MPKSSEITLDPNIGILGNWKKFNKYFWIFFILKTASYIILRFVYDSVHDLDLKNLISHIGSPMQIISILGMVILMGKYAYRFTGRKISYLYALLGFLWIAIVGIFIGYFAIKSLKDYRVKSIVKEILKKYDPAGVMYDENNQGEYTPEINKIAPAVNDKVTVDELADHIHHIFVEHFDETIAGGKDKYQDIAKEILDMARK